MYHKRTKWDEVLKREAERGREVIPREEEGMGSALCCAPVNFEAPVALLNSLARAAHLRDIT